MGSVKRVTVATVLGLLLGFLAWLWAKWGTGTSIPWYGAAAIILSRGALGFAIGISALTIKWWLHGLLLGFIFSLPAAFGARWAGMEWIAGFTAVLVVGLVIGFLIEFVTSILFKAKVPG